MKSLLSVAVIIILTQARIIVAENGPTTISKYPYMVSIQSHFYAAIYNITGGFMHLCEGVTVAPRYVLFVGHCVYHDGTKINRRTMRVMAGDTFVQYGKKYNYGAMHIQGHMSKEGLSRTNWQSTIASDVGLIELITPIPAEFAQILPLYEGEVSELNISTCVSAYWGYHINVMFLYNRYHYAHDVRQQLRASEVTLEECPPHEDERVQEYSACFRRTFKENFSDRCGYDVGAPIVCEGKLVALLLQDNSCRNQPDRYLLMKPNAEWIYGKIRKETEYSFPGNLSLSHSLQPKFAVAVLVPPIVTFITLP